MSDVFPTDLLDRGWRRSGSFLYKPEMETTCCPAYTIRLKADNFSPSKEQLRVSRRMQRYNYRLSQLIFNFGVHVNATLMIFITVISFSSLSCLVFYVVDFKFECFNLKFYHFQANIRKDFAQGIMGSISHQESKFYVARDYPTRDT